MRIAAIIPGLPEPADRGTYKRYRAWVHALAALGDLDLVCLRDRDDSCQSIAHIAQHCHRFAGPRVTFQAWRSILGQMRDRLPPNVRHWFDPATAATVSDFFKGKSYDMVFLGDLVSIPYAETAGLDLSRAWIDRARVDIAFQRQRDHMAPSVGVTAQVAASLRRRLTARYERYAAKHLAGEVVCATSDLEELHACVGQHTKVMVIPNGIEREAFPDQGPPTEQPVFMLPGAMDYLPNIDGALWFINHAWPLVRAQQPTARLLLVGRDPVPSIMACHGENGIRVTGAVASMLPWYARSRVAVAPIRIGCGTRLKVVEAWSVGRALVGTNMAVDGLAAHHGHNCLLGDSAESLAKACLTALQPTVNEQLRQAGLRSAQNYAWDTVLTPATEFWNNQQTTQEVVHACA